MKESRRSEVTVVTVVIGRGVIMSEVVTENVTEMVIVVVGTVIVGIVSVWSVIVWSVIVAIAIVSVVIVRGMYKVIVVLPCHKVLRTSVTQFSVDQFWVAWWA